MRNAGQPLHSSRPLLVRRWGPVAVPMRLRAPKPKQGAGSAICGEWFSDTAAEPPSAV